VARDQHPAEAVVGSSMRRRAAEMGEIMSDETGGENPHIRITCPHCRKQFERSAAWIEAHDYVRCDFCRDPIGLGVYKAAKAAGAAKRRRTKR
jgi:hypothetical protein